MTLGSDGNIYGTTFNGGANGQGAVFRVNQNYPGIQVTGQPASQSAYLGANAVFSVAVAGNGPLTFQWRENGTNLTDGPAVFGSATRVLTVSNVAFASAGVYSVLISNSRRSVLSANATLSVIEAPAQILQQPASQNQTVGGTAVFTVTAVGDLPISYQWQWNGTNLTDGGRISGSSTSALTLTNLVETNDGLYSVIISNPVAVIPSAAALLTVYAPSVGGTTMAAVHTFTARPMAAFPMRFVPGSDGLLYGTTQTGGQYGFGTIFSLSTNGIFTTLASFDGTNGATPMAGLVQYTNGFFYGTTQAGGSNSAGDDLLPGARFDN